MATAQEVVCDPARTLSLTTVGGSSADLKQEYSNSNVDIAVTIGGRTFAAAWEGRSSTFLVDLRGTVVTVAQLSQLKVVFAGYRIKLSDWSTERQPSGCVGHYSFTPSRIWRVNVDVPQPNRAIELEVVRPAAAGSTWTRTPKEIPTGSEFGGWDTDLEWATPLRLEVYPIPGERDRHFLVDLRASDLNAEKGSVKCAHRDVGRMCFTEDDIRNGLIRTLKPPPVTRFNPYVIEARRLSAITRIKSAPVVTGIEFQLVKPKP